MRALFTRRVREIGSLEELLHSIGMLLGAARFDSVYLRGHSDHTWPLVPTLGRAWHRPHGGQTIKQFSRDAERYLFHRFRRGAYPFLRRNLDTWEALFLARHHALPVRLLDWTVNPLVALYHATTFTSDPVPDGAVWAFRRRQGDERFLDVLDPKCPPPKKIRGIKIIYPFYASPRMVAQAAVFTIQDDPWTPLDKYDVSGYKAHQIDIERGEQWIIPAMKKASILRSLERLGANYRHFFPELDGLVTGIMHSEIHRKGVPVGSPTNATPNMALQQARARMPSSKRGAPKGARR